MGRKYRKKELINTRLLKDYASWIYCEQCDKTIGYLCYTTYKSFKLSYLCKCGNRGSVFIDFDNKQNHEPTNNQLYVKNNRFHCPADNSALLTILQDKLISYDFKILCESCNNIYLKNLKE